MAPLPVLAYPDPRLRQVSQRVETVDASVGRLIDTLLETLAATTGIGLCAPQIGELRAVLVVKLDDDSESQAYVNPEVLSRGGLTLAEESCLSLPGIKANVFRSAEVRVRAQDRSGEWFERDLDGLHAVCVQHEVDHLAGTLFIDRLSALRRWRFRSALRALEQQAAPVVACSST